MSIKKKLDDIEARIEPKKNDISIKVNWCEDDLIEWDLEDGSVELITREEFKSRGGILVEWSNDED